MSPWRRYGLSTGFSLVEMMITVVILGLLVSGAYEVYDASATDSRYQSMRAEVKVLKTAIDQYHAKTGQYPGSLEALTRSYLNRVPDDPSVDMPGNTWMVIGPHDDPTLSSNWVTAVGHSPADGIADVRSSSEFHMR